MTTSSLIPHFVILSIAFLLLGNSIQVSARLPALISKEVTNDGTLVATAAGIVGKVTGLAGNVVEQPLKLSAVPLDFIGGAKSGTSIRNLGRKIPNLFEGVGTVITALPFRLSRAILFELPTSLWQGVKKRITQKGDADSD